MAIGQRLLLRLLLLGIVVGLTSSNVLAEEDLVPFGASWSYLAPESIDEDPNIEDGDFATTWFLPDYDITDPIPWSGPSPEPLGYGTVNGFNNGFGTDLPLPLDGDRYTAYFRHEFTTMAETGQFALELLTDDGSKVYLDGQEVYSLNCCEFAGPNEIADFTELSLAVGDEDRYRTEQILDGETLPPGDHILAVAVHNQSPTSSDLGFSMRFIADYEPPQPDPNAILEGIDTTLAQVGLQGPDGIHGDLAEWEWDGEDAGGENHGLLWFDIPQEKLDNFGDGEATLRLPISNEGNSGEGFRITEDWLSGPDGGNNATWELFPNGPGIFPGDNTVEDPSFVTGDVVAGTILEIDVTDDVQAWASGESNYGWGFVPTGNNGAGVESFETGFGPQLIMVPEGQGGTPGDFDNDGDLDADDLNALSLAIQNPPADTAFDLTNDGNVDNADHAEWVTVIKNTYFGDANLDGEFNTGDFVVVFQLGKFETGQSATWTEGDWNNDGLFSTTDFVTAFQGGGFEQGPRAGVSAVPEPSGLLLLAGGLFCLVGLARRKK